MIEWVITFVCMAFITAGLIIATIAAFGLYRFHYILNRMHAAAVLDTLVILLTLFGTMLGSVMVFETGAQKVTALIKTLLVILFLWYTSPVCSHLIVKLELMIRKDKPDTWEDKEV